MKPVESLWAWARRGLIAGALFALVENLFTVLSGYNIPLDYLMTLLVAYLLVGFLVGVAAGLLLPSKLARAQSFPLGLVLFGIVTAFFFFLGKTIEAGQHRLLPGFLGPALLVIFLAIAAPTALWMLRCLGPSPHPEVSFAVSLLLFDIFLVGGYYLTTEIGFPYFSSKSIAINAALTLALAGMLFTTQRLFVRKKNSREAKVGVVTLSAIASAVFVTLAGWGGSLPEEPLIPEPPSAKLASGKPNVVLISIDALRADRLSAYGYERETTPVLDQLAADGVLYLNALSPSNWTLPGHASMLTGTFPRRHGAHIFEAEVMSLAKDSFQAVAEAYGGGPSVMPLQPGNTTLAKALSDAGYTTAAVVANSAYLNHVFGLDQGFDFYDARPRLLWSHKPVFDNALRLFPYTYCSFVKPYRLAADVNSTVFRWIEPNAQNPFFLFINYMEPHSPYCAPSSYDTRFPGRETFLDTDLPITRAESLSPEESKHFRSLYDGEISYVDYEIGVLFDRLKNLGVYDNSLIIVTADHGEYFGEHGLWMHGVGAYEEVYRVPLIVKYPRSAERKREDGWVQTIDIFPTVLEVLGLPVPNNIQGQVLGRANHPLLVEQYWDWQLLKHSGHQALYEYPWKLVLYSDGATELFNMADDPHEGNDLSSERPDKVEEIRERLEKYVTSIKPVPFERDAVAIGDETRRKLEALGYVQ